MSRPTRVALGLAAVLVGVNAALAGIGLLDGGTPGGPASSTYATGADGAAAYADLLREAGHRVRALREAPADLAPDDTLVLLDAVGVTGADAEELRGYVETGGRLVVGGAPGRWLERVSPETPEWREEGSTTAHPVAPVAETVGVDRVEAVGFGSWEDTGAALPVVAGSKGPLVSILPVGAGRVILLADASPLSNERLSRADNAALGLAVAGPASRDVLFAESYHGYGSGSGIDAIPDDWLAALAIGMAAIAIFMLARGRRLGPPEPDTRELAPARLGYVDALGALLARARDRVAAGSLLHDRARRDAARLARVRPSELEPPGAPVLTDADLVAAGDALARMETSTRRNV